MKRSAIFLALFLLLASPALAQKKTVPLSIVGETYLVVKTLPFNVVAPAGASDYSWVMPAGVDGTDADNVLTVTKAPQGQFVIKVKMTTIDFDAKKIKKDTGEITVVLGGLQPPAPPTPTDKLTTDLQTAYTADAAAAKADYKSKLASLYRQAVNIVDSPAVKSTGDLYDNLVTARKNLIPDDAIVGVRKVIQAELSALGGTSVALTDASRAAAKASFTKIATALDGVK